MTCYVSGGTLNLTDLLTYLLIGVDGDDIKVDSTYYGDALRT